MTDADAYIGLFDDLVELHEAEPDAAILERVVELGVLLGSPLEKIISGGQRKRLNIALELIREPTPLFVDEPTSSPRRVDGSSTNVAPPPDLSDAGIVTGPRAFHGRAQAYRGLGRADLSVQSGVESAMVNR